MKTYKHDTKVVKLSPGRKNRSHNSRATIKAAALARAAKA